MERLCQLVLLVSLLVAPRAAWPQPAATEGPPGRPTERERLLETLSEIDRNLTNPVSNTWSLAFTLSNYLLSSPTSYNPEFKFEPLCPLKLTAHWSLILKPEFILVDSMPYSNSQGNEARATGLGDTSLPVLLTHERANWILAFGPTFMAPTATSQQTGAGKWQVGPAVAFGYLSKHLMLVLFPQQWWSFAGQSNRSSTSHLKLQYYINCFLPDGWSVGTSPSILVNWNEKDGQKLTFPVGIGVSKVLKLFGVAVKFGLDVQYMPIRPDSYGQEWNVEFSIVPRVHE